MTTATVMTLNTAQISYLKAALACMLTVQGQAAQRSEPCDEGARRMCWDLRSEALDLASAYGTVSPLDHQDGAELAELLGTGTLELRFPGAALGITPYYSDVPGGLANQVGADEEAWRVPVTLTVVGAETALDAAHEAGEFLARATAHDEVNDDETVQAYDVVGYEAAMPPNAVLLDMTQGRGGYTAG